MTPAAASKQGGSSTGNTIENKIHNHIEALWDLGGGGPLPGLLPPRLPLPFSWVLSSSRVLIVLQTPKNTSVPNNEEHRTKGTEIT